MVAKFNYRGLVSFSWIYLSGPGIYISPRSGIQVPAGSALPQQLLTLLAVSELNQYGSEGKGFLYLIIWTLHTRWTCFSEYISLQSCFFVGSPSFPEKCLSNHRNGSLEFSSLKNPPPQFRSRTSSTVMRNRTRIAGWRGETQKKLILGHANTIVFIFWKFTVQIHSNSEISNWSLSNIIHSWKIINK